jgi:hypothetical protein
LQARIAQVLDVPYTHLVFALPHEFNGLYRQQPRVVIDALFASVQQTLSEFAANARWMGVSDGQAAFTLVLYTWSQDLGLHIHLHAIMACGVLGQTQWYTPIKKPDYLFPTRALSKVWRGKFMQRMNQSAPQALQALGAGRKDLWRKDWVVYAKTPLGGAAQVLEYLSRYTHRTAIGNERIARITQEHVTFSARAKGQADEQGKKRKKRTVRMAGAEFIARFLQHVLPTGLKRIRHYGLLANPKGHQLAQAKVALHMPVPSAQAQEGAQDFMARVARINISRCPACERGRLRVVQTLQGQKRLPDPLAGVEVLGSAVVRCRVPPAQGP